ncbi:MAG TPA: leucyl/phenylalanyl-tRNA--protein transferase [Porticoccaceae bacterium]|jgi:leucyl/phenylalanyl-tRNA--protein transferase|nr:leucyl/phenylalanyl-tRNA--protein transferase [Gammaproteobacteria bacterium]HIL59567.1 leucyl/phenylalanyl-tRNA--protein transferase [Porticoccaceae bacterium]
MPVPWLEDDDQEFPGVHEALEEPNGLLAAGGSLAPSRLLSAYSKGIFPWYELDQPILWWSPDPRLILVPDNLLVSRSLARLKRRNSYSFSIDKKFVEVMQNCAAARPGSDGTWITDEMFSAYSILHQEGVAHSVEVWSGARLVGGLYGVAIGKVFFGESMFSKEDNTSKLALVYLVNQLQSWGFELIDCQVTSNHLLSLGATEISRNHFMEELDRLLVQQALPIAWQDDSPAENK